MNDELEQLKKLIFTDEWEEEDKEAVRKLEATYHAALEAENLTESPAIKHYIKYLADKIDQAETTLKTKRTSAIEQEYLFAIIELGNRFTTLFTGKARQDAEKAIKHNLDVAKSHQ